MRIPVATYRFQFRREFTFAQALKLIPYLRSLGISDLYASPLFPATPGSTHGYDVCSMDCFNPSLGTRHEFDALASGLREAQMGLLLDLVPNHMGAHESNQWWQDVLKHGRSSPFAAFFDIDWDSRGPNHGKVLLPVLGDHYRTVLERGELKIDHRAGEFFITYFDKRFPVSDESAEDFQLPFASVADWQPAQIDSLVARQHYRLTYWRTGAKEINYRRFFDVTELVSVRVEDENVFRATHQFAFELLRGGAVTGLRIDHPDGLRDPKKYFDRLQSGAPDNLFVVAEKILSGEERLSDDWAVQGTTGYDFLNHLNGIFVQSGHQQEFTDLYRDFCGTTEDFETIAHRSKREVLDRLFVSEVNSLTRRLLEVAKSVPSASHFREADLRWAITEFIAGFPVYRTYVTEQTKTLTPFERECIESGLKEARTRNSTPDSGHDLDSLTFLAQILRLEPIPGISDQAAREAREFVIRFQQLSGPATAKGLEDTAFYRYARFVSLNEVGGNPGRFGVSLDSFHEFNRYQQALWPNSMLATATHDTKRGEDTRARLNILSEMPEVWKNTVLHWRELNKPHRASVGPVPRDEYLLYQSLVGTWLAATSPAYVTRIQQYMLKAIREAKEQTSWTEQNDVYEKCVTGFVAEILESKRFTESLAAFAEKIAFFGVLNSLSQVVLKTCSPGVPDFYQGTELWDFSLVDPDNRTPVDYELRNSVAESLNVPRPPDPAQLLRDWNTGAVKLFVTAAALRVRTKHIDAFRGEYLPIAAVGSKREHLVAFARRSKERTILAVVPRFVCTLTNGEPTLPALEVWEDTALDFPSSQRFRNTFTGEEHRSLRISDLFRTFPVAILEALS